MEFEIPRSTFADALSLTQGVVERRNTLPILSNVLIESADSSISLLATDLDVGIRLSCPANVKGAGAATVSARTLFDATTRAGADTIRLRTLDSGSVEISSGRFKSRLPGLDPKEFPPVPGLTTKVPKAEGGMLAPASLWVEMIEATLFAVSLDETRFNLSGVYAESCEGSLRMVATDGHRLALIDRTVEGELPKKGVILPRKGLAEVKKVLAKAGGPN
jgi:DNA polymerase III subunit beta